MFVCPYSHCNGTTHSINVQYFKLLYKHKDTQTLRASICTHLHYHLINDVIKVDSCSNPTDGIQFHLKY